MSSAQETTDAVVGASGGSVPVALYVHVPFCASKCAYCDFVSVPGSVDSADVDSFVGAVLRTLRQDVEPEVLADVPTIYIGGGTPSMLGADGLVSLLSGIAEVAHVRPDAEITVEANPDSVDAALVEALAELGRELTPAGVLRVSLGVQSFDDDVLRTLGRRHNAAATTGALALLKNAGVRVSLDLMCGIPGQSPESWRATLDTAVASGVGHVSVYPLTVEEGTPLARSVDSGQSAEPDADVAADMMETADEILHQAGIERYEIANYARPGQESLHNTGYWTGVEYLGVGPSAASMLSVRTAAKTFLERDLGLVSACTASEMPLEPGDIVSRVRFVQPPSLDEFLSGACSESVESEWLTANEASREDAMLGLRLCRGISVELVQEANVTDVIKRLEADGLLERAHEAGAVDRWRLTRRGWLVANEVFGAVWTQE
ncbi:MAG: radical SAM family heme chaperone HemW [Actinomycetota bacterium]|jgi:putative oxygen-independent coproporphyrinogen III oxidase|nr:radical SAM family heme chaperone HemW [Actinomycetota bacterium]